MANFKLLKRFRFLLERMLRDRQFTRRLPSAFSRVPIRVSTSGGLGYAFKSMAKVDPALLKSVVEWVGVGDVVWDVGANLGVFSVAAASRAGPTGQVISFEPDTWLVNMLRNSAAMQPESSAKIQIVPVAISWRTGLAQFRISKRSRAMNHLEGFGYGIAQAGGASEQQTVVTLPLDEVLEFLKAPDVLKIDVEGGEASVLKGAEKLLTVRRPIVICEVASETAAEVTAIFAKHMYSIFDADQPVGSRDPVHQAVWNTVAVPAERVSRRDGQTILGG